MRSCNKERQKDVTPPGEIVGRKTEWIAPGYAKDQRKGRMDESWVRNKYVEREKRRKEGYVQE